MGARRTRLLVQIVLNARQKCKRVAVTCRHRAALSLHTNKNSHRRARTRTRTRTPASGQGDLGRCVQEVGGAKEDIILMR